ncbi:sulfotransferase family protein [Pediococcus siamensis]|uniref:sulfotransferase family protein n=1 Tax=Pediococcus siamensis TaxID=381829 RepID=UPI0039A0CFC0
MAIHIFQKLFPGLRPKRAVLVLGSGRSGTSVLTKCINFMGISLGTDNLLAPSKKINPKGYFENKDIINIHKKLGSKIRYRPAFKGYYDSPKIKKDRAALTTYLKTKFQKEQYLVIKDPRMNDYIELWQHVLDDIQVRPAEIILIRNPLDVVASNSRAWHRDKVMALRQWQVRTLLSLRDTKDHPRLVVSYEDLFHKTLPTLHRIATQLDLPWPKDEQALQAKIDGFIDPNLQKSDSGESLAEFKAEKDLDDDVKELYLLGVKAANSDEFLASDEFDRQINDLTDRYIESYGSLYRDFNVKIDSKTVFVYGSDANQVAAVNKLLTDQKVVMQDQKTKKAHQLLQTVSDRLADDPQAQAGYEQSYSYLELKEDFNNYLRKGAKKNAAWGIGDVLTSEAVEMLMTVSEEMNLDTRNILVVDDQALTQKDEKRAVLLKRYERVLNRVSTQTHLVVAASTLQSEATQKKITAFLTADHKQVQIADYRQIPSETVAQLQKLGTA